MKLNIYRNNYSYDNYEVLVIFLTYEMIEGYLVVQSWFKG